MATVESLSSPFECENANILKRVIDFRLYLKEFGLGLLGMIITLKCQTLSYPIEEVDYQ